MLAQFSQVFGKLFNLLRSLSETTAAVTPSATVPSPSATVPSPSATVLSPSATVLSPSATVPSPSATVLSPSATVLSPSANPPIASTNYNVDLIWNQIESAQSIEDLTDLSRMIFINRLQYLDSELPGFMQCPKCATYSSRVEDLEAQTTMFIGMIMNVEKKVESDQMKHDAKSDGHLTQPPVDHPTELPVVHPKEPPDYPVIPVQPPVGHPMQSPVIHPQQTLGEYSEQPPDYPKKPPGYPVTWREWKNKKKWKERNERRNEETSGKDSKQMNNICNKQTNTQLFHSSASPLLLTDTFLLMTLIPAGQCFLKFVSNFLSGNNSTADDSNNRSRENEHESLELFRNSLTQRSSLFSQDWDKVHFNMLRSTSLQNFSVSHFNFFPTGSHVENVYRTSTPPRSQIEHNYLTSLSPESRFENHFHASPSPEPQEKHCSEKDLIDNHQQTISVMEDSLKLYENDVSYLENNIQALRNKSQESDKLIRELERNVSRLNKLLERKESDLAEANRKVHNYHKYYCWSLVQIANLMKEENSLRDENINLLLLMEECCSDNEYCEEKLKEYQEKLNMIEKEMSELTMDIERRNQSFQEEKAKSADATAKLRAENESLKVQCEVQTSEAAKCSQMMTLYKKRIEQVKHLLETKTYEISNLEKNINLFEDKLNQAEKDKHNALNELQSIKTENKDLTETTRTLTETIAQLETSLGESKAQMTTLCETLTLVRDELKQSQDENQQLKLSLNNMEDELNSTKLSYETKLKQKNTELTILRDESTRSTNQLRDQLDQLSVELAQCQGTREAWHTELDMVRTELKCKNELSRVLEEQHQRLNLSYEALYKEFTDTMAELTERKEELSQLNEAMTKMKQHNEVLKQIEVDFKTREQNLEQVVLEKLKSFESEVLEKTETISRLEEQNNKHEIQVKQLSEQIEVQSKDINQLSENIQVKNEQIKQLREDIYAKNEEITRLNEDIQVKNEGISRLKDKLTTLEHADNSMNTGYDILCTDKKSPDTTSIINAQEILSLLEINSAHCKRYHALEKAYRELSLECSALHRTLSASPALSAPPSACLSNECSAYVSQIKKLSEENKYLQATLSDYKRINSLLLDQIKVSVHHPVLEDSLPPQTLLNTRYNIAEKEDNSSTLSVDDRNTADLWWENEVNIPHALTYDNLPCTETKSL